MPDVSGKNCLVTGAARGLGAAIAENLWRNGANLLLVGRSDTIHDAARKLAGSGRPEQTVYSCVVDLAEPDSSDCIMGVARDLWPRLDGLVNNAAIQGPIGVVWENDWDEWTRALQVNLLAPVSLCRLAAAWMTESGNGSIVNLAGGGATAPRPHFTAYATTKAALVRFSETLALETQSRGVRINCVAPGAMNTNMLKDVLAAGAERVGPEYERALRRSKESGDPPEQAADLIAFLLSDQSAGITGRLISAVWDPWRTWAEHKEDFSDPELYTLRRITPRRVEKGG